MVPAQGQFACEGPPKIVVNFARKLAAVAAAATSGIVAVVEGEELTKILVKMVGVAGMMLVVLGIVAVEQPEMIAAAAAVVVAK